MSLVGVLEVQLMAEMGRLSNDMKRAERVVSDSTNAMTKSVTKLESQFGRLGSSLSLVVAFDQVRRLTDDYVKLTAQLKIATTSQADYAQGMKDVHRISTLAQADINATTFLYTRLTNALSAQGVSQKSVANITEAVGLGLKAYGATAAEAASAMMQLSQAFASNRLGGEEFRAVSESMPNLMMVLAKSMGVPRGELRALSIQGKITAAEMAKAWDNPEVIAALTVQANMTRTITGEFIVLRNNIKLLVGEFMGSSGATSHISSSISLLSDGILLLSKHLSSVISLVEIMTVLFATRYAAAWVMAQRLVADHTVALAMNAQVDAATKAKSALSTQSLNAALFSNASANAASMANMSLNAAITAKATASQYALATATSGGTLAQLNHARASGVMSGNLAIVRQLEAELAAVTAAHNAALAQSVIWTNHSTAADRAAIEAKAALAVATGAATTANTAHIAATKVLEASTLSTFDKIKGFAKANAPGLIGLALWGIYEVADHFGFIDKLSNKMGEFFNTQNSRVQQFKALAGGGAAGDAAEAALAAVLGREAAAKAKIKSEEDLRDALSRVGGTFKPGDASANMESLKTSSQHLLNANAKSVEDTGGNLFDFSPDRIAGLKQNIELVKEFHIQLSKVKDKPVEAPFSLPASWFSMLDNNISEADKRAKKIAEIKAVMGEALSAIAQTPKLTQFEKSKKRVEVISAASPILAALEKEKPTKVSDRQKIIDSEQERLEKLIATQRIKLGLDKEETELEKFRATLTQKSRADGFGSEAKIAGLAVQSDALEAAIKEKKDTDDATKAMDAYAVKLDGKNKILQREIDIIGMSKAQRAEYDAKSALAAAELWQERSRMLGVTSELDNVEGFYLKTALQAMTEEERGIEINKATAESVGKVTQALIAQGKMLNQKSWKLYDAAITEKEAKANIDALKKMQAQWKSVQSAIEPLFATMFRNIIMGSRSAWIEMREGFKRIFIDFLYEMTMKKFVLQTIIGTAGMGAISQAGAQTVGAVGGSGIAGLIGSAGGKTAAGAVIAPTGLFAPGAMTAMLASPAFIATGVVVGGLLVAKYGFGLGNKRENVGGNRLVGEFTREGFSGNRQQSWELDRGAFRSTKRGTDTTAVGTAESRALLKTANDLQRTFDSLGDAIGQTNVRTKQWRVGMNLAGDVTNALSDGIGRDLIPALDAFREAGENLAQTASRLTNTFNATNFLIVSIGLGAEEAFGKVGIAGTAARERLIKAVGTLDQFNQAASFFVGNFLTDAQKTAYSLDIVARTFADLGIAGVETNEQFAELVKINTELGNEETVGRLLGISEAFFAVTKEAKKTTDQLTALIKTNTFSSLVDYQRAVGLAAAQGGGATGLGAIDTAIAAVKPVIGGENSANTVSNANALAKQDAFGEVERLKQQRLMLEQREFTGAGDWERYVALAGIIQTQQAYAESLPSFAVGTNYLPKDMPIMAHQGERIIPRADNTELMSRLRNPQANNDAMISELRSLRQEVASLQAANVSIALNTNRSAKMLERFDGNGMPAVRDE